MIIKNIHIENFRSYYGVNEIALGDGLTLIIGANGDGKTTFFEALEWLFDTVDKFPKVDTKYISKKKSSELSATDSAYVKVSMTYTSDGNERIVEKSFKFTKSLSAEITTSNYSHVLFIQNGVEKDVKEGEMAKRMFDRDFAASIRKYCLFKGEQDLNIFNKEEAMSYLVETFSQIRDFDPYLKFMSEAKRLSEQAVDAAIKTDTKNTKEAQKYRNLISGEEKIIGELNAELKTKLSEAVNFQTLLENIEKNREASQNLVDINGRLDNLKSKKKDLQNKLNENYTFRLLDEMWILMGFEPVAQEYREKIAKLGIEQRTQQSKYDREIGAKKGVQKAVAKMKVELSQGIVPLAVNVPDENTMREMLDQEICKVCNRPAPVGSDAYIFMKKRLDAFLTSLDFTEEEEEEVEPLFKYSFIKELTDRYAVLHNNMNFVKNLKNFIDKSIRNNIQIQNQIEGLKQNIEADEEKKKQILAQTDGLSEDQLVSAFHDINEWWNGRRDAENRSEYLKIQIKKHEEVLEGYQEKYSKISEESSAAMYGRSSKALRLILEAFSGAKNKNKRDFLNQLESVANEYLELLNKGDFRGHAHIKELANNSAEIVLQDTDGTRIYNPNTALKTTMYMSLLFAVAKLTTIKHENDYPLIFDAPTSSFTSAKESDFYGVIGNINKQTIIVTKSFLIENENGSSILDTSRLNDIKAVKYRIQKKLPFDEKNLATIQTIIEPLN